MLFGKWRESGLKKEHTKRCFDDVSGDGWLEKTNPRK